MMVVFEVVAPERELNSTRSLSLVVSVCAKFTDRLQVGVRNVSVERSSVNAEAHHFDLGRNLYRCAFLADQDYGF